MSTFWFAGRDSVALLLVVWAAGLGLVGVLRSMFMLAVPANVILAANVATLALFIISFEVLKKKRRSAHTLIKHRGL
jgi:hypothetical protein